MKRIITILAIAFTSFAAIAQNQSRTQFVYDVNFEYNFDNREFDTGGELYTESKTINAARLTPSVGVSFLQNSNVKHTVMVGIDVMKDMGKSPVGDSDHSLENTDLFREMTLWYGIEADLGRTVVNGYAGMFPRRYSVFGQTDTPLETVPGRNIPTAFLSDEYHFYDNNVEGFMVSAQRRHSYAELGLDWLGMYGSNRREQFIIFSYGKGEITDWISAGWALNAHHYANAIEYGGVVDDVLVSPFIAFDFKDFFRHGPQALCITVNAMTGFNQDRERNTGMNISYGGQVTCDVRNWNVGLRNETYYGTSLMPYYNVMAPEGTIYGSNLYRGNPFYCAAGAEGEWNDLGLYDRCEACYQPQIAPFLNLRISFVMHFAAGGFQGWQQKLGLIFDLGKASSSKPAQARKKAQRELREFDPFPFFL